MAGKALRNPGWGFRMLNRTHCQREITDNAIASQGNIRSGRPAFVIGQGEFAEIIIQRRNATTERFQFMDRLNGINAGRERQCFRFRHQAPSWRTTSHEGPASPWREHPAPPTKKTPSPSTPGQKKKFVSNSLTPAQ